MKPYAGAEPNQLTDDEIAQANATLDDLRKGHSFDAIPELSRWDLPFRELETQLP